MTPVRILGALLVLLGLVWACAPTLVSDPGPAVDSYAAIERRIPGGGVAGLGALLFARTTLRPWAVTFALFVAWVVAGLLVARTIGLALDGADDARQWMWWAVEAVLIGGAVLFVRHRQSRSPA